MPTFLQMFETVSTLSPEITFTSTPLSLNHAIVSLASGLIVSSMATRHIGVLSLDMFSLQVFSSLAHRTSTLKPSCVSALIVCLCLLLKLLVTNSGAPSINVPSSTREAAENFLSLENSSRLVALYFLYFCSVQKCFFRHSFVILLVFVAKTKFAIMVFMS